MRDRYQDFQAVDVAVVGICFASVAQLQLHVEETTPPFPVVTDPTREAYRAFGLGHTSWGAILSWRVVRHYLRLMLRGWMPRASAKGEDVLQLGGDFLLDDQHRIIYQFRSGTPTERPTIEELLRVARQRTRV